MPIPTPTCTSLVIGDKRLKITTIAARLRQEIRFLQDRINTIQQHRNPNNTTLNTYTDMLVSRQSVLDWLDSYSIDKALTDGHASAQQSISKGNDHD